MIRDGEADGTYLVVDDDILSGWDVHVSPFGAVPKSDSSPHDEIRLIHDLAFPPGASINDQTDKTSLPPVTYESVVALAQQIEHTHENHPGVRILMLKGDVQGAFRHHADDVFRMRLAPV
ncbi:hypothetical protein PINS_up008431 [Pythium insidiosum]|nr:hypothetical protein PINS_up008431 [Pythium insidiosum]